MKITVEDHAPGAGAGRRAYLEDRARRVLGQMSERVEEITIELGPAQPPGHRQVNMTARLSQGDTLRVSVQRRLLPDALADAFDALVTRIALNRLNLTDSEGKAGFARPSTRSASRRPSAY